MQELVREFFIATIALVLLVNIFSIFVSFVSNNKPFVYYLMILFSLVGGYLAAETVHRKSMLMTISLLKIKDTDLFLYFFSLICIEAPITLVIIYLLSFVLTWIVTLLSPKFASFKLKEVFINSFIISLPSYFLWATAVYVRNDSMSILEMILD